MVGGDEEGVDGWQKEEQGQADVGNAEAEEDAYGEQAEAIGWMAAGEDQCVANGGANAFVLMLNQGGEGVERECYHDGASQEVGSQADPDYLGNRGRLKGRQCCDESEQWKDRQKAQQHAATPGLAKVVKERKLARHFSLEKTHFKGEQRGPGWADGDGGHEKRWDEQSQREEEGGRYADEREEQGTPEQLGQVFPEGLSDLNDVCA